MPAIEERNDVSDLKPTDRRRWLEGFLARRCPGAILDSLQISGLHPTENGLHARYRFHTSMFAVRRESGLVLHPGSIQSSGLSEYFRSPSRVQPIRFRFGTRDEVDLTVHLPAGWEECHSRGSEMQLHLAHGFSGLEVPPGQYGEFQKFLDAMELGDLREIEVGKAKMPGDEVKREDTEKD